MRHDTRVKLDRQIKLRRLKLTGAVLAMVALVVSGFLLVDLDAHETSTHLAGTVEAVQPFTAKGASGGYQVGVKLDDGRHVSVLAGANRDPHVGDHIEVSEHRHLTGRTTFAFR